jgi:hypothetical protein
MSSSKTISTDFFFGATVEGTHQDTTRVPVSTSHDEEFNHSSIAGAGSASDDEVEFHEEDDDDEEGDETPIGFSRLYGEDMVGACLRLSEVEARRQPVRRFGPMPILPEDQHSPEELARIHAEVHADFAEKVRLEKIAEVEKQLSEGNAAFQDFLSKNRANVDRYDELEKLCSTHFQAIKVLKAKAADLDHHLGANHTFGGVLDELIAADPRVAAIPALSPTVAEVMATRQAAHAALQALQALPRVERAVMPVRPKPRAMTQAAYQVLWDTFNAEKALFDDRMTQLNAARAAVTSATQTEDHTRAAAREAAPILDAAKAAALLSIREQGSQGIFGPQIEELWCQLEPLRKEFDWLQLTINYGDELWAKVKKAEQQLNFLVNGVPLPEVVAVVVAEPLKAECRVRHTHDQPIRYGIDGVIGVKLVNKPCHKDLKCPNDACAFLHSEGWNFRSNIHCPSWYDCSKEDCQYKHPKGHNPAKVRASGQANLLKMAAKASKCSGRVKTEDKAAFAADDFVASLEDRTTLEDFNSEKLCLARLSKLLGSGLADAFLLDGSSTRLRFAGSTSKSHKGAANFELNDVVLVAAGSIMTKFDRAQCAEIRSHLSGLSLSFAPCFFDFGSVEVGKAVVDDEFGFAFEAVSDSDDDEDKVKGMGKAKANAITNSKGKVKNAGQISGSALVAELIAQQKFEADATELAEEIESLIDKGLFSKALPKAEKLLHALTHADYKTSDVRALVKQCEQGIAASAGAASAGAASAGAASAGAASAGAAAAPAAVDTTASAGAAAVDTTASASAPSESESETEDTLPVPAPAAAGGGGAAPLSESDDDEEEFGTVLVKSGPRRHEGESDKAYTARCKKEQGKKAAKDGKGKGGKGRR